MRLMLFGFVSAVVVVLWTSVPAAWCAAPEAPVAELFATRCTVCHDQDRSKQMHLDPEGFLEIVRRMAGKQGASVSEAEAERIAAFLGDPDRRQFEKKCLSCHGLDKMAEAHLQGRLTVETIRRMKEKGADISDQEAEAFHEGPVLYYFPRK